ncbi:MAG: SRPBCC domain-containing protein [Melioribacteraceae bacterium]|nr:MAG: SRPBCC domain-containing protein [Melioribacteraceae bacterium]
MNVQPLIKEVVINADASKVWEAITNKDKMKEWYFDIAEFKPEVGFEFQFAGQGLKGEQYIHLCKITEVIHGKKLSYTWTYKNYQGTSTVTFELFSEGKQTRVKLTHAGIENFATDNPDFAIDNFNEGWTYLITKALKEFAEK